MTTHTSKKGSEKVLGRGFWGEASWEGFSEGFLEAGLLWVLQSKGVLRRVLRRVLGRGLPEGGVLAQYDP